MSYLPLARKWRPQSFADVVGQEVVTTTLANAITQQRVAPAYLFAGPRGVGKTSTARILAKCLNCEQGPTTAPCQRCVSCVAITQGSSLDVLEIDGASNRGIDQIRELRENVKYSPSHGRFKVYIIDEVHQITPDGFNALLKTLEEPPAHVRFIFATTQPQKVLPTILSRCQRFDFQRVPVRTIVTALQRIAQTEQIPIEEAALFAVAKAADGSLRDAESMLDQLRSFHGGTITTPVVTELLGLVEEEALLRIITAVMAREAATALRLVDALIGRGKDVTQLSQGLVETAHHLLLARSLVPDGSASPPSPQWAVLERLIEMPREVLHTYVTHSQSATASEWLYVVQLLARTHETIKRSQQGRIHWELMLVKLATRADFTTLQTLLASDGKGAALDGPSPSTANVAATSALKTPAASTGTHAEIPVADSPPATPHPTLILEEIQRQWSAIVDHVGQSRMSIAACLSSGRPLEVVGERVVVGVPDVALHRELLESAANRQRVERAMAETLHLPRVAVMFRPIAVAEVPPPTPPHPEPPTDIIQSALKMFDAKVVEGHL